MCITARCSLIFLSSGPDCIDITSGSRVLASVDSLFLLSLCLKLFQRAVVLCRRVSVWWKSNYRENAVNFINVAHKVIVGRIMKPSRVLKSCSDCQTQTVSIEHEGNFRDEVNTVGSGRTTGGLLLYYDLGFSAMS